MIQINRNPEIICKEYPSVENLENTTRSHIQDVCNGLNFIADLLRERGPKHDQTKLQYMNDFYQALFGDGKVKDTEWYHMHTTKERHHLKSYVPEDVNLVDVIEHIVDCTVSAFARDNGIPKDVDLDPSVLQFAVQNTVKLLQDNIEVISDKDIMNEEI